MFILTARHILANIYHSPFWWLGLAGCHASGVRRLDFGCVAVTFGWINKRGGTVPPQPYGSEPNRTSVPSTVSTSTGEIILPDTEDTWRTPRGQPLEPIADN